MCYRVPIAVVLACALLAGRAGAQAEPADEQVIQTYAAPVPIERAVPQYPATSLRRGAEGWVEFNFMVSPEGKPYEVYVIDHAGDDAFIAAARSALERTIFSPARLGDEPIDGSSQQRYIFELDSASDGGRRSFGSRFRVFMAAVGEESQSDAESALELLEELGILNAYEDAFLNLARYTYALRYGDSNAQMKFLRAALGESLSKPDFETYLDEDTAREARRNLAQLQIRNAYFAEAMDTLEMMRLKGDDEGADLFRDTSTSLAAFKTNDAAYPVKGRIEDSGSWGLTLFKTRFRLADLMGAVQELKLRCEQAYICFPFDPEVQYSLADDPGQCTRQVIGDPGTTFDLIQSN